MAIRTIDDGTGLRSRTTLKKSGGSLVMTVPARARDALHLAEGQELTVSVDGNRLVLEPSKPARPTYALDQLLAQCDFDQPYSDEERAWLDAPPVGRELL
jgi:antitoxin ChpS